MIKSFLKHSFGKNKMDVSDNIFAFESNGWNIDCTKLYLPKLDDYNFSYSYAKLLESPDNSFACLFYAINEYRMGAYTASIAIYKNKAAPILVSNPENQWFDYKESKSVYFFDDYFFVRKLAHAVDDRLSGTPFVAFNLQKSIFCFIDFDWTSIYYSLTKVDEEIFQLKVENEYKHYNFDSSRDNEVFDLKTKKYYSMDQTNDIDVLYLKEKIELLT
jgi:hypothetical protein